MRTVNRMVVAVAGVVAAIQGHLIAEVAGLRVVPESLSVRSGPDSSYDVIGTVHGGEIYISTEMSSGYYRIWYNRSQGWVHDDQVELASTTYDDVFTGTNVRTGPSTSYPKVGYAKVGSKWAVVDTSPSGTYHQIFYEGELCWFSANGRATTESYTAPEEPETIVADEAVRVVATTAVVRSGAGVGYPQVGTVSADQVYMSTESFDGWRRIWYSRDEGWIAETDVAVVSAEYDVVDWSWLNVRTGPGTGYTKITSVPVGSKWVSLGYEGAWHHIYFEGATAWYSGTGATTFDFLAPGGGSPSPTSSHVGFIKLPASGPGLVRRCGANNPDHCWGTPLAVNGLIAAASEWAADHPDYPRIRVGDISLPDGGPFEPHYTHQNGTDMDLFLLRSDSSDDGAADIYDPAYSSARTREWITDYLTVHLPGILSGGILFSDPDVFGTITTSSPTALCPGEGCPLDAAGEHVLPSTSGLSYVRCKPGHHDHMQVQVD